jgi:hypothetical protein
MRRVESPAVVRTDRPVSICSPDRNRRRRATRFGTTGPAHSGHTLVVGRRWGRITEVIDRDGPLRYRVAWLGDIHDSVVVPPPDARVESADRWPSPGGDAIGVWPH